MSNSKWMPLESNPSVMNNLLQNLGVSSKWKIADIISFDEEYLKTAPKPILAVLFLFPYTKNYKEYHKEINHHLKNDNKLTDLDVYFMPQTISNSCGTVALIHAIANNMTKLEFEPESVAKKFIEATFFLKPDERARKLELNHDIQRVHEANALDSSKKSLCLDSVSSNQAEETSLPEETETNHHYITLVNVNSKLYELDGYKNCPVFHGNTNEETFLNDAANICQDYINRDNYSLNFSALSFGQNLICK